MAEPSMEIGFSNETLLLTSLLGFTLLFASLTCLCHFSPSQAKYDERDGTGDDGDDGDDYDRLLEDADVSTLNRAQRKARAKLLMKKKRKKSNSNNNNNNEQQGGDHGNGDGNVDGDRAIINAADVGEQQEQNEMNDEDLGQCQTQKLSRKERQKAAKEEERLYRREYEEIRKLKIKDEMERREAKEQRLKEKKESVALEKQKARDEELDSWKYMFEGDGSTISSRSKDKDSNRIIVTVDEFVKDLNETQVIKLDETANKFQVSVEELVDRLKQLEKEGRIDHGIIDKKGRIYFLVNEATMKQISEVIKEKEAITLDDITKELTRIIHEKEGQS